MPPMMTRVRQTNAITYNRRVPATANGGAGDFDADGVYLYRLIHPDSTSAEACHTVTARQEGEAVGKAWYNGEEAAGGTER